MTIYECLNEIKNQSSIVNQLLNVKKTSKFSSGFLKGFIEQIMNPFECMTRSWEFSLFILCIFSSFYPDTSWCNSAKWFVRMHQLQYNCPWQKLRACAGQHHLSLPFKTNRCLNIKMFWTAEVLLCTSLWLGLCAKGKLLSLFENNWGQASKKSKLIIGRKCCVFSLTTWCDRLNNIRSLSLCFHQTSRHHQQGWHH